MNPNPKEHQAARPKSQFRFSWSSLPSSGVGKQWSRNRSSAMAAWTQGARLARHRTRIRSWFNSRKEHEAGYDSLFKPPQFYSFLVHAKTTDTSGTAGDFAARVDKLFPSGRSLLPFVHVIATWTFDEQNIGKLLLKQDFLQPTDSVVVMRLTEGPWFAHGAVSAEPLDLPPGLEIGPDEGRERKLAIDIYPTDLQRVAENFRGRFYDCEVTNFLHVVKTTLSVNQFGERLLQEGIFCCPKIASCLGIGWDSVVCAECQKRF
jgi:hypothetical protein